MGRKGTLMSFFLAALLVEVEIIKLCQPRHVENNLVFVTAYEYLKSKHILTVAIDKMAITVVQTGKPKYSERTPPKAGPVISL